MSRDLPEFPNLDHLRKQAKVLLRVLQQNNPEAKLAEAQHMVARQYGFASWVKLKAHVESLPRPTPAPTAAESASRNEGGVFARYTMTARRMIFFARYWAGQRGSPWIETEHLLLGLIEADGTLVDRLLQQQSAGESIRSEIERRKLAHEELAEEKRSFVLSSESRRILDHAVEEADRLRHDHIGSGHLLLAILREEAALAASILIDSLKEKGVTLDTARNNIARILNEELL